ncbi:MAG: DNA translocase FtsK [Prevotellaceae bacterium]|jgi:S-DNA-T family DNA segregation ATPase FtsK/SpoIIIE|nr:DNA translocase FtsK [Prevotellaceae bacterium]
MAKKKKKEGPESAPTPKGREAWRLISGIIFGILGVYTFVALTSYIFTWTHDQNMITHPNLFSSSVQVENGGGKIGFLWAHFLMGRLFGLGALIIPFFFLAISFFCLKIKKINLVRVALLSLFGCIILSVLSSFIFSFSSLSKWLGYGVGGSYGHHVNQYLITLLGLTGTGLLLVMLFVVWLFALFPGMPSVIWSRLIHPVKPKPEPKPEPDPEPDPDSGFELDGDPIPFPVTEVEEPIEPIDDRDPEEGSLESVYDPKLDLPNYQFPTLSLLEEYKDRVFEVPAEELEKNNKRIVKALSNYGINIEKIRNRPGPTVTLYEIYPAPGVRIAQIKSLEDDIALSLAARGLRIIAPIPGTNAVGIEVANDHPSVVPMRTVLDSPKFRDAKYELPIVIGKTISNEVLAFDLAKMPHLLVAGATGQGKSVGLNAIITSLLYRMHPSALKFVLVDPKQVELSIYAKLEKHFLAKMEGEEQAILTDTQKVVYTLKSLVDLMEKRISLLSKAGQRNILDYNNKFLLRKLNPNNGHEYMPYIVVVIDEFADLIMTAGKEVELPITRLAQKARAVGIHLIVATQRPDVKVITGLIKANFPARIAFKVVSIVDSRTIIDIKGANQLIGRGDMLLSMNGELTRVQCAWIDTPEVERITEFISDQNSYGSAYFLPEYCGEEESGVADVDLKRRDPLFDEAARLVVQFQQGSTSLIQRRMNLGYNRAGRIMDQLEAAGIVGPQEGSKARQVMITDPSSLERIITSLGE